MANWAVFQFLKQGAYFISVYPLGLAYAAGLCLLYLKWKEGSVWKWLAAPGRMALTNYIGQSVIGMFLFYGIGGFAHQKSNVKNWTNNNGSARSEKQIK